MEVSKKLSRAYPKKTLKYPDRRTYLVYFIRSCYVTCSIEVGVGRDRESHWTRLGSSSARPRRRPRTPPLPAELPGPHKQHAVRLRPMYLTTVGEQLIITSR